MLKLRVITALILAPLVLLSIFAVPHAVTAAVLALLVMLGTWEWSAFPGFKSTAVRCGYTLLMGVFLVLLWRSGEASEHWDRVLLLAVPWWLLASVWIAVWPERSSRAAAALAGVLVLIPSWIALVRLHGWPQIGPQLLTFLLLLVVAADVGAYFAGRSFGRHKLAPRVSPGKTWEGVAGGVLAATVLAVAGGVWFSLRLLPFTLLCMFVVLASVIGDLTESLFKRHAGVKDSGSLLPGHGGILDRVDSVTAAAPFFLLGLQHLDLLLP
jgi:phosphatidate cytidylyltransferase